MSSTFSGLNTARLGLVAQRFALDLAGQNVANTNTEGYTRQRAQLVPLNPVAAPALFSKWEGGGAGVSVGDVQRIADSLVDGRMRAEHETAARLTMADEVWGRVDGLLAEPTDDGLSDQLATFFGAWHDVANQPDSAAARVAVIESGRTVADTLARLGTDLGVQWSQVASNLDATIVEFNTTVTGIADLNRSIQQGTVAGLPVNELLDRRDVLVNRLVEIGGGTVVQADSGMVDVFIGGIAAVRGTQAQELELDPASPATFDGLRTTSTPVALRWTNGLSAGVSGGSLGGTLEGLNTTLPGAADDLDAVAADLAAQVNALHVAGKGLDGVSARPFFTGTTTADLAVAVTSEQVAAAGYDALDPTALPLDGSVADAIGALGEARTGPPMVWAALVTEIGAQAQTAARRVELQEVSVREADSARLSVSGVDVDQEMTDMIMFQRAYEGSARVLSAVDEMLDVLINRTGLVGR